MMTRNMLKIIYLLLLVSLNSFAQALAGRIQENCFESLDAPIHVIGSENLPAIPLNSVLEDRMLPNSHIISKKIEELLQY